MTGFISSIFFRRIKLYGFGLGLGLMMSYAFFGDRYPTWLPGSIIKEELSNGVITYSERVTCLMECGNISKSDIDDLLTDGDVNFGESDVHREPCPHYVLEGTTADGRELKFIFEKCDSTALLLIATEIAKDYGCLCD